VKRAYDVFFFTLIDFLVQVAFFFILLFVVSEAARVSAESDRAQEGQQVKKLRELSGGLGFSNLTELTDYLTKLVPVSDFKGIADFIASSGGGSRTPKRQST